jgi:hypothetical protein
MVSASTYMIVFRFLHIVAGAFWFGAATLFGAFWHDYQTLGHSSRSST